MILWAVLALLPAAVAALAVCWWGSGLILYPPALSPMWIFPEQFGLRYEKMSFRSQDGIELKGWLVLSPTGDSRTIVMCHGWGDNKGELLKMTYFLNETAGFNLLYFDFRAHGESGGDGTTIGALERRDFDAAVRWLRDNRPDLAERAGVFGLSMGAAVTIASMPEHPWLRCAVVESPYSDYRGVVRRWAWNNLRVPPFPLVGIALRMLRWRVGDPTIDSFNPVESAGRVSPRPLLVIGGDHDDLMPEEDVRRVFAAAREPKQLWIIPGAYHARCRDAAGMEYDARVAGFFQRHL